MDAKKREIRNVECQLSYREAAPDEAAKGELGYITGTAIVFNAESEVLDEYGDQFREVILPEAAPMDFIKTQDIKINMLHMRELTFGRYNRGVSGNAEITVDREGVHFKLPVPNCDLGIRARELTKAGVLSGCSFEFWPDKYTIEERENDVPLVRHQHFRCISALTLGMDPAYQQTSLAVRELVKHESDEELKAKQEAEAKQREQEEEQREKEAMQREMERRAKHLAMMSNFDEILENNNF